MTRRRAALHCAALALLVAAPALASEERPTPAELESELVCPVCETTLDSSDAPVARLMKARIRERIAAGDTKSEIKAYFVDQFGEGVLAVPPRKGFDLIAWLLPLAGLAAGALVVGALAWRWSRTARDPDGEEEPVAPALDPELEQRLDDELARFET
ncbi:MAG TPA: cytochrome c-type biogenesis protein [Gaiellaceae bacterium]|nr:cytochrome c-type biogenesis protein [Gaiellaceae bacterium]